MSRLFTLLFALVLVVALVVAIDPNARRQATAMAQRFKPTLQKMDDTVVVHAPSIDVDVEPANQTSTPQPTATPFATPVVDRDDEDSSDKPFIVINWDALGDALQNLWNNLKNIRIDINPHTPK